MPSTKQRSPALPIGKRIDKLFNLREKIDELNEQLSELKSSARVQEGKLMRDLQKQEISSGKGKRALVSISIRKAVRLKDRKKIDQYVKKNNAFDLFQNRLNSKAVMDRLEEGEEIPGISIDEFPVLHMTKR